MSKTSFELPNYPDTNPELLIETGPNGNGVGDWVPNIKHAIVAKYIDATKYAQRNYPHRVFIDPFSGPGRIQVRGESFTRPGGALLAWHQSLKSKAPFTKVLVGDVDADRARACKIRLLNAGANALSFEGPALDTVPRMIEQVHRNSLCLAYIDPYNLEYLSFSIIKQLALLPKIDFAIHFSIMDLARNVEIELADRDRFEAPSPGWRDRAPVQSTSKASLRNWFFEDWCRQITMLGFKVSREMPLVTDSGRALYRLVFFSRHSFPDKIWNDVAKSPSRGLFD